MKYEFLQEKDFFIVAIPVRALLVVAVTFHKQEILKYSEAYREIN